MRRLEQARLEQARVEPARHVARVEQARVEQPRVEQRLAAKPTRKKRHERGGKPLWRVQAFMAGACRQLFHVASSFMAGACRVLMPHPMYQNMSLCGI